MKIAGIQFPEPLLAALRDGKLVVFAGAGVSIPSGLPNFTELAKRIAVGTDQELQQEEPEDHFLGRLQRSRIKVHERAVDALTRDDLSPNALHKNLLRLYSDVDQVRIVTTNFDLLFEQAVNDVFDSKPEVFRAPALPLGRDFNGIIHIHGDVNHPNKMVLTDADFGRGYLTEGWARRFLVDLFRHFTVLFVGYSHNDTMMNYLARALPMSTTVQRFALTERTDAPQQWQVLGIKPIEYPKADECNFSGLNKGVQGLADTVRRNILGWQREITEIAGKPPPLDEEAVGIIEYALKDVATTRFFTNAARSPKWIDWLDEREQLDSLFSTGSDLSGQDSILASWLAEHFAYQCADDLFLLIARHEMHLHPQFWQILGQEMMTLDEAQHQLDKNILSRWVSVLLATVPESIDPYILLCMGECCIKHGMLESLLLIFNAMAGSRLHLKRRFSLSIREANNPDPRSDIDLPLIGNHYALNELWEKGLKPDVARVAEPTLRKIIARLDERYLTLRSWQKSNHGPDDSSWRRLAIEPHEKNPHSDAVDVLIDAARDCLDWLAVNQVERAASWCNQLIGSEVPLLRRLAVHALSGRADLTADDKIAWLLAHIDFHYQPTHHEIFRIVKISYPEASTKYREKIIETVLDYHWPYEEDPDKDQRTAYHHFNWLDWLHRAAPDCALTKQALDNILAQYPKFEPMKHPDLTHDWTESGSIVAPQSPWQVDELLTKPAAAWLPELLSFQPTEFPGPDRNGLVRTVAEAAKQRFNWGIELAGELAKVGEWDSDIWSGLIRAWSEMELDEGRHGEVLRWLACVELHPENKRSIANALYALVKNDSKPYALNLLPQANKIAFTLWRSLDRNELHEENNDWLQLAINHPAGILAEFWVYGLSLWRRQQDSVPSTLNEDYRQALSSVVQDPTLPGRLGRSVLCSQLALLLQADEIWAKQNLLPHFEADKSVPDLQAAWDGFLTWGRVNPTVAELLEGAFLKATQWLDNELACRRDRFIKYYTVMLGYFATNPLERWIPQLFSHGGEETRRLFALAIAHHLREMDEAHQREWWQRWLKRYWKNRLQGVPEPLAPESGEVEYMLGWLPDLTAVFPEAVALATCMPQTPLRHSSVIYELKTRRLSQNHPEAVAQLLIHLGESDSHWHSWHEGAELIDNLLQSELPLELKQGLKELMAKLGLTKP